MIYRNVIPLGEEPPVIKTFCMKNTNRSEIGFFTADWLSRAKSREGLRPRPVTGQSRSSNARPTAVGFEILPNCWIVEHTFAWLSRFRRLARDFERFAKT